MDFTKATAELETLLMQCVASGGKPNSDAYLRTVAIWRQATWHALERAYLQGIKDCENNR